MSVPRRISFPILAVAALAGCDPITSISRTATVGRLPARSTVSAALREIPGTQSVRLQETKPSASFSLYEGVTRDPAFDQFLYRGTSASCVVEVRETEKGAKTVRLYSMWMGPRPPKAAFDFTRTLMDLVYAHLRQRIPYLPPQSEVTEDLTRPPLR